MRTCSWCCHLMRKAQSPACHQQCLCLQPHRRCRPLQLAAPAPQPAAAPPPAPLPWLTPAPLPWLTPVPLPWLTPVPPPWLTLVPPPWLTLVPLPWLVPVPPPWLVPAPLPPPRLQQQEPLVLLHRFGILPLWLPRLQAPSLQLQRPQQRCLTRCWRPPAAPPPPRLLPPLPPALPPPLNRSQAASRLHCCPAHGPFLAAPVPVVPLHCHMPGSQQQLCLQVLMKVRLMAHHAWRQTRWRRIAAWRAGLCPCDRRRQPCWGRWSDDVCAPRQMARLRARRCGRVGPLAAVPRRPRGRGCGLLQVDGRQEALSQAFRPLQRRATAPPATRVAGQRCR